MRLNPYTPRVAQRLAHARLMLEMLADLGDNLLERQRKEALLLAVIWHLGEAFTAYLREMAWNHRLSAIDSINSLSELDSALMTADRDDALVQTLKRLEREGWVQQLQIALRYIVLKPVVRAEKPSDNDTIIAIAVETDTPDDPTEARVQQLYQQFSQTVEWQRNQAEEY